MLLLSFGGQSLGSFIGAMAFWVTSSNPKHARVAAIVSLYLFILA
jgi:hypothetical protein